MKPVAILRFSPLEGPGYFATCLEARSIPIELVCIDAGDSVPAHADGFSGISLMGGPMSVNDPLPWIPEVCRLIRDAFVKDIPMIGHCLGGQLISKALGGRVQKNPVKEVGWSQVTSEAVPVAADWFGELVGMPLTVFQWHGETFSVPMQAQLIASNGFCRNQIVAFGRHLAMQCHIEMTSEMIEAWCGQWEAEMGGEPSALSIQTPAEILSGMGTKLNELRSVADVLYARWINQLAS